MRKRLKVNFVGGILVTNGPVTGERYKYDPTDQNSKGEILVDERDAPGLLDKKVNSSSCGCSNDSQSGQPTYTNLFTEIN